MGDRASDFAFWERGVTILYCLYIACAFRFLLLRWQCLFRAALFSVRLVELSYSVLE
jgi:hypothetical protein